MGPARRTAADPCLEDTWACEVPSLKVPLLLASFVKTVPATIKLINISFFSLMTIVEIVGNHLPEALPFFLPYVVQVQRKVVC